MNFFTRFITKKLNVKRWEGAAVAGGFWACGAIFGAFGHEWGLIALVLGLGVGLFFWLRKS